MNRKDYKLLLLLLIATFPLMTSATVVGEINYNLDGSSGDGNIPYKAAVIAKSSDTWSN